VTIAQFKWRLEEKIGDFRSMSEAMLARECYDQGISVHLTQKRIEEMRKAAWN